MNDTSESAKLVFIDTIDSPDIHCTIENAIKHLKQHNIRYLPPSDNAESLRNNLLECDCVLFLFENQCPVSHVNNKLSFYRKVQIKRSYPLNVTIYTPNSNLILPELNFPTLFICHTIEDYTEILNVKS